MNTAYCMIQRVPFCCGAFEVGNMHIVLHRPEYEKRSDGLIAVSGGDKEEAASKLLKKLLQDQKYYSLQFWFKRSIIKADFRTTIKNVKEAQYAKEFAAQELMDAVIEAGGLEMGRYINPNTKNELYGIILTNNCVSLKE